MSIRKRALITLSVLGAGFLLALSKAPLQLPTLCLFKRITGLPCGACGMTHACCSLAHGNLHDAINYHFASIPLALVVAAASILLAAELITNRPFLAPAWKKTSNLLVTAGVAAFVVGWAVNLFKVFHT